MSNSKKLKTLASSVQDYTWALAAVWTMIVAASLAWNVVHQGGATREVARVQARVTHMKDILFRRWNASHGGVYVPVTENIQPNPYLAHLPERDVTTLSGMRLTLINPAYMTRLVHELQERESDIRAHITSLKPIKPGNAADPWETKALQAFERGEKEVSSMVELDGKAYMGLMRPLFTEQPCLKCHGAQGYKVGDIRGGISVSVPMKPLLAIARRHIFTMSLGHAMLWILGLGGLSIQSWQIKQRVTERDKAEEALRTSEEKYRLLTETANEGIYILGPAGFEYVNPAFQRTTGYPAENCPGRTSTSWTSFIPMIKI